MSQIGCDFLLQLCLQISERFQPTSELSEVWIDHLVGRSKPHVNNAGMRSLTPPARPAMLVAMLYLFTMMFAVAGFHLSPTSALGY